jgi:hypothetical protein
MALKAPWPCLRHHTEKAVLLETRVGVKSRNQLILSQFLSAFAGGAAEALPADALSLSLDALADEFTLLHTPVISSPHFRLFERFRAGKDITSSDYFSRLSRGTLDFRGPIPVTPTLLSQMPGFLQSKLDPATSSDPVLIARIGGRQLIVDGKHKAAALAWLGLPVPCLDITAAMYDSYYRWIYNYMKKHGARYSKHIRFFAPFYEPMKRELQ